MQQTLKYIGQPLLITHRNLLRRTQGKAKIPPINPYLNDNIQFKVEYEIDDIFQLKIIFPNYFPYSPCSTWSTWSNWRTRLTRLFRANK